MIRAVPPGILSGPIVPTMLRLALPTIIVPVVQTLVGVVETYFVSFLGTEALAGVALVFHGLGADPPTLFRVIATAAILFGSITAAAMLASAWGRSPDGVIAQARAAR